MMLINFRNIIFSESYGSFNSRKISGLNAYDYVIIWTPQKGANYYFSSNAWEGLINDNSGYLDLSQYDSVSPLVVTIVEITDTGSKTSTITLTKQGIGYYVIGENFIIAPESSDDASIGSYIIGLNYIIK